MLGRYLRRKQRRGRLRWRMRNVSHQDLHVSQFFFRVLICSYSSVPSTPYLILNCNTLIVNMCLRLSTESATLCPTPIAPSLERLGTLLFFGSKQFRHSLKSIQSTLSHFTSPSKPISTPLLSSQFPNATSIHTSRPPPISHFPVFHLLACFLPLGVLLQSSKVLECNGE